EYDVGGPALDSAINLLTMVKTASVTYQETNGTVLSGYLGGLGCFGTSRPTMSYVFGSQQDLRYEAASKGWLTYYPEFNQEFSRMHTQNLNFRAEARPIADLTLTINASKDYKIGRAHV